jgi:hypothetical protein
VLTRQKNGQFFISEMDLKHKLRDYTPHLRTKEDILEIENLKEGTVLVQIQSKKRISKLLLEEHHKK